MLVKDIKFVETRMSKICWEDEQNGIVITETKPKVEVTVSTLKEDYEVYKNNFQHPNRKIIADITELHGIGKEARDYMAGGEGIYNYFEAIAFYSSTMLNIGSILAQVSMKVYTLKKPTKLFYNKEEAISWLKRIE
jgi:hypothetical protein